MLEQQINYFLLAIPFLEDKEKKRYFLFEGGFIFGRSCLILFTVFKHQFGTEVLMKQGKRTNKRREPTNERK